jgi:hypothetical protein
MAAAYGAVFIFGDAGSYLSPAASDFPIVGIAAS